MYCPPMALLYLPGCGGKVLLLGSLVEAKPLKDQHQHVSVRQGKGWGDFSSNDKYVINYFYILL